MLFGRVNNINFNGKHTVMVTRKLQEKNNGQKVVTVPDDLATAMGWEQGDDLDFTVQDKDTLQVKKK